MTTLAHVLAEVEAEARTAQARYGPMASTHEALGVLLEEWTELQGAVHKNDLERIRSEAIQVAAVALRLALNCRDHAPFAHRSVK